MGNDITGLIIRLPQIATGQNVTVTSTGLFSHLVWWKKLLNKIGFRFEYKVDVSDVTIIDAYGNKKVLKPKESIIITQ